MTKDQLIAALEKATGPDRDLDIELTPLIYPPNAFHRDDDGVLWVAPRSMWHRIETDGVPFDLAINVAPHYTSSRDSMLPGAENFMWNIVGPNSEGWIAKAFRGYTDASPSEGIAATEPLARRIAELKALVRP